MSAESKNYFTTAELADWLEKGCVLQPPPRLAVFGWPVKHSLSPQMHNPALRACGIDAQYIRIAVEEGDFKNVLGKIQQLGFLGTNVTIPHKFAALESVDILDERAARLGAVNTICFRDGKSHGFNSDGPGFVRAVKECFGAPLSDLRVLLLGAGGGAGRATAVQCALEKCARLYLANRTEARAHDLRQAIAEFFPSERVSALAWNDEEVRWAAEHSDLIVNCTNQGMNEADAALLPADSLRSNHLVLDMVYTRETPLLADAKAAGAKTADGLPMLLHQGAVSFEWWFHQEAPLEVMREALQSAAAEKRGVS